MIQKLKSKLIVLASLFAIIMPAGMIATSAPAYADVSQTDINGSLICGSDVNLTQTTGCKTTEPSGQNLEDKIKRVINLFSAIVGIVSVIMIIYGGFRYVTSGGKQESVTNAKNTILYAIVGLIIVALSQAIVHFVLNHTTT